MKPTFEDVLGCESALFEWAESYDTKACLSDDQITPDLKQHERLTRLQDWARLRLCIAPKLRIDYRSFLDQMWEDMPAEEFVQMASHPQFLGNPLLRTQHLVGASRWEKTSEDEIVGRHQMRVPHQKYTDTSFKTVAVKGHSYGGATILYKKFDGVWKFAGLEPHERWFEYDYDKIFTEAATEFKEHEDSGSVPAASKKIPA